MALEQTSFFPLSFPSALSRRAENGWSRQLFTALAPAPSQLSPNQYKEGRRKQEGENKDDKCIFRCEIGRRKGDFPDIEPNPCLRIFWFNFCASKIKTEKCENGLFVFARVISIEIFLKKTSSLHLLKYFL